MKSEWQNKVAVVTGASSGIGEATAQRLAGAGLQVTLVARRLERLHDLREQIEAAGGKAKVIAADLSREADRCRVFEGVQADGGADVLINNAGFGWYGYYREMPWSIARQLLQVNIGAAVHLTSLFLPEMVVRNQGHIINVGSIAGSIPSQGVAVYSASKSFLDAFTTALYRETRGTKVRLSVVRVGPVRTEFCRTALQHENGGHIPTERIGVSADYVAERIWQLLLHPKRVIYVPRWLSITPWVELSFGWLEDRIGPMLLRRQHP
ncbi:MAG TPA: SDR family NAD(P)-dependent oxidoreductase [Anaerolineales bacterium]|nr:SDR family NAD(P)-dependent oxidoreductase [Anaerolineales bacterium]